MTDIEFLKHLQKTMLYENEHNYDSQAHPRFWVLMDYRKVIGKEGYDNATTGYFYVEEDDTEFHTVSELVEFMSDVYGIDLEESVEDEEFNSNDLHAYFNFVLENHNDDDFFAILDIKEEQYIVPDTMFLTKESAKRHIKQNQHNLSSKVHTYAMTAYRSPEVERLINILHTFDFDQLQKGDVLL